ESNRSHLTESKSCRTGAGNPKKATSQEKDGRDKPGHDGLGATAVIRILVEPIVRAALLEDLGRAGDITSDAVVPAEARVEAVMAARQGGGGAGVEALLLAVPGSHTG